MKRGIFLLTAGLCLLLATTAWAAHGRDARREAEYENQLAAIDPTAVPDFRSATEQYDRNNYAEAERLYQLVHDKAPDWDVVNRRLGSCLVLEKKRTEGLVLCEKAVQIRRSSDNLIVLARNLILREDTTPSGVETARAVQLVREALKLPGGQDPDNLATAAQVFLQANEMPAFREVLGSLRLVRPDEIYTHYFLAILAAVDEHWIESEDEIRAAEKLGLPHEAAESFLASGIGSRALGWRTARFAGVTIGLWMGGLVMLFALGFLLSKLTLRQAEAADVRFTVNPGEHRLRKVYRTIINLAGVYYYLSLPIVVVLVLGIVAALLYLFLCIGQIPIKLMLILGIGAVATVISLVRSLFVKVKTEDPGRALKREEAEALWQLTEEVARTVNTRPIDEIRVTTGTELAVYERGGWREKMQNKATRILILGVGVLNDFRIDDFRAVLAHEYGHFSNRDTAGGDIALRVRSDMLKFYHAMYAAGQATHTNVAFHFLRMYNFIFRRISHGATRLQEILADRVAAQNYGALAFEGGLRHVIRRGIEFHRSADLEVRAGVEAKRPLANLYDCKIENDASLEKEYEKSINRATTEDDTHPSPKDRFRLVASLQSPSCAARPGEVWTLFKDREAITREMMTTVERNVARHRTRDDKTAEQFVDPRAGSKKPGISI